MPKTIIVSNRLPVKISEENGSYTLYPTEGGLATGLVSTYRDGGNIWIGWPCLEVSEKGQKTDLARNAQANNSGLVGIFFHK